MVIHKAYKFRLYPTKEQQILIGKTIVAPGLCSNRFLSEWNQSYKDTGKGLSYGTCSANLTALKKEADTLFLKEVDSIAIAVLTAQSQRFLRKIFQNQNSAPRFKSKRNPVQSYTTKQTTGNIAIVGNKLKLPKLGLVPFAVIQRSGRKDPECHHKAEPVGQVFHLHFSRNRSSGTG